MFWNENTFVAHLLWECQLFDFRLHTAGPCVWESLFLATKTWSLKWHEKLIYLYTFHNQMCTEVYFYICKLSLQQSTMLMKTFTNPSGRPKKVFASKYAWVKTFGTRRHFKLHYVSVRPDAHTVQPEPFCLVFPWQQEHNIVAKLCSILFCCSGQQSYI